MRRPGDAQAGYSSGQHRVHALFGAVPGRHEIHPCPLSSATIQVSSRGLFLQRIRDPAFGRANYTIPVRRRRPRDARCTIICFSTWPKAAFHLSCAHSRKSWHDPTVSSSTRTYKPLCNPILDICAVPALVVQRGTSQPVIRIKRNVNRSRCL
jgi:hypothetical protein